MVINVGTGTDPKELYTEAHGTEIYRHRYSYIIPIMLICAI